jgi:hypothetical protein
LEQAEEKIKNLTDELKKEKNAVFKLNRLLEI